MKYNLPLLGHEDINKLTEEELYDLWRAYYPKGSGPLGAMKQFCKAIELIATLKGFDISDWPNK